MARRVLRITDHLLADILKGLRGGPPRYFEVAENPVPADARVVDCRNSPYRPGVVEIVLESAEFSEDEDMAVIEPALRAVEVSQYGPA